MNPDAAVVVADPVGFVEQPALNQARYAHAMATVSSGGVVVAGGFSGTTMLASVELRDGVTGMWTEQAPMRVGRANFTATPLNNGTVLLAGGGRDSANGIGNGTSLTASTDLFNLQTGQTQAGPDLALPRSHHTATLLSDGRVLISGGTAAPEDLGAAYADARAQCEIFDPATQQFTATGPLNTARFHHRAAVLPDQRVVVVGGFNPDAGGVLASCEIWDPATGQWSVSGNLQAGARFRFGIASLADGRVMVAGGTGNLGFTAAVEFFSPTQGTWSAGPAIEAAANSFPLVALRSGRVLRAGGYQYSAISGGKNLDTSALLETDQSAWTAVAPLKKARWSHTAALLDSGDVLVVGGAQQFPIGVLAMDSVELSTSDTAALDVTLP